MAGKIVFSNPEFSLADEVFTQLLRYHVNDFSLNGVTAYTVRNATGLMTPAGLREARRIVREEIFIPGRRFQSALDREEFEKLRDELDRLLPEAPDA